MTRREQNEGCPSCPRCKGGMDKHPFTRQQKLFMCEGCGWKIPHDKITKERIVLE